MVVRQKLEQGEFLTDKKQEFARRWLAEKDGTLDHEPGSARRSASENLPAWGFFRIVRDSIRNKAYETTIAKAIRPGCRVLDIGTGTGLFAMMAARAGAAEVITCERNPAVAAAASEIIARNGFAHRVRVIVKNAANLRIGIDLAEPADLLIWDVLDNTIVGFGGLALVENALRHLLRPGAMVIPARGSIRIALIEDQKPFKRLQMPSSVKGFDLSPFNQLARPWVYGSKRLAQRSEPEDLFRFDFQSGTFAEARASVSLSASGGVVNGIVQWLRLDLDDKESYENVPFSGRVSAFRARGWPLQPFETAPGTTLTVCGAHNCRLLSIWAMSD